MNVQAEPQFSERLNKASVQKRRYPWDSDVIDWSVPITSEYLYMPERYSVFYANPAVWNRLSFEEKSFATRWEFTQLMRNAGKGEHLLNQAILSILHHADQYDPAWRFMLHEVAEECQHMAMFNSWVRLNGDIKTKGLADDKWGLWASVLTPIVATNFPVFFWTLTMMFEVTGDDVARAQSKDEAHNLHPIVQQLGDAHVIEELRHIAFAKNWIAHGVQQMSRLGRLTLAETTERILGQILKIGFALPYSHQLERLVSYEEFKTALRSDHRRAIFNGQIRPTVNDLVELGVIRQATTHRWEKAGLLTPQA